MAMKIIISAGRDLWQINKDETRRYTEENPYDTIIQSEKTHTILPSADRYPYQGSYVYIRQVTVSHHRVAE